MALIPEMDLKKFQMLSEEDIRDMQSTIITGKKGGYIATLIVPQTDYIKSKIEYLGELSNGVKPRKDE